MLQRYRSADHVFTAWTAWEPERPGERVNDHILLSRSNSNAYLVSTTDGDVLVNTGTLYQGERHRERFEELLGRPVDVRKIVLTQSHDDHVGGLEAFDGPDVDVIAEEWLTRTLEERKALTEYFIGRSMRLMGAKIGEENLRRRMLDTKEPRLTTTFSGSYAFEQGDRRFELYSAPGGETLDGIIVWLPDERTVFTGNLLGALFPQIPHLSTIRGDRQRSARAYIDDVQRLLDLGPELLITGHHLPIEGADKIQFELTRLRDCVQYIHDETVKGMAARKDMWTLMREIQLPEELQVGPNRGPVWWYVRAVWEEYTGWFRFESTTDLYAVPANAVWEDLASLAGADALAERAQSYVDAGQPLQALHLTDIALAGDAQHRQVLEAQLGALEQLMADTGGDQFDLLRWLEGEIERVEGALAE
jgi:glyoxylase-like metal-dependent hydrolase (beta-lactamase superfamily II)